MNVRSTLFILSTILVGVRSDGISCIVSNPAAGGPSNSSYPPIIDQTTGYQSCYSYTVSGNTMYGGTADLPTCQALNGGSGVTCCSTDNCNAPSVSSTTYQQCYATKKIGYNNVMVMEYKTPNSNLRCVKYRTALPPPPPVMGVTPIASYWTYLTAQAGFCATLTTAGTSQCTECTGNLCNVQSANASLSCFMGGGNQIFQTWNPYPRNNSNFNNFTVCATYIDGTTKPQFDYARESDLCAYGTWNVSICTDPLCNAPAPNHTLQGCAVNGTLTPYSIFPLGNLTNFVFDGTLFNSTLTSGVMISCATITLSNGTKAYWYGNARQSCSQFIQSSGSGSGGGGAPNGIPPTSVLPSGTNVASCSFCNSSSFCNLPSASFIPPPPPVMATNTTNTTNTTTGTGTGTGTGNGTGTGTGTGGTNGTSPTPGSSTPAPGATTPAPGSTPIPSVTVTMPPTPTPSPTSSSFRSSAFGFLYTPIFLALSFFMVAA